MSEDLHGIHIVAWCATRVCRQAVAGDNKPSMFTHRAAAAAAIAVAGAALLRRRMVTTRAIGAQGLTKLIRSGTKAVCVGKNYRDHINELSHLGPEWKVEAEVEPVLFLKPTSSYAYPGEPLRLPRVRPMLGRVQHGLPKHGVHHEVELGVIIGSRAKDVVDEASAMACVAGYVVAIDVTERDEQTAAKVKGMPWSVAKGYDSFLPLSEPFTLGDGEDWRSLRLWLDVNGERRQTCDAGVMIHSVPSLVMFASSVMTLEPGDLIVTGTPEGVGPLVAGDVITAGVEGHAEMRVRVEAPTAKPLSVATTPHALPLADPLISRCEPPLRTGDGSREPRPLGRLTFSAKDNLDVSGMITGNGSPCWAKGATPAVSHASPVARLLDAGATLVGKAHMDELAFSVGGENAHYGTLDNPIAPGRTVGGSSSGSAVAVASGLCDFALGTDTSGSVRVPAAHCGLFGLRTSHGAIDTSQVCALAPSFDTVGIFARDAAVIKAVGDVVLPAASTAAAGSLLLPPETPTRGGSRDGGGGGSSPLSILIADDLVELYQPVEGGVGVAARKALEAAAEAAAAAAGCSSAPRHIQLGEQLLELAPTLRAFVDAQQPRNGLLALMSLMREIQAFEMWTALGGWAEPAEGVAKPSIGFDLQPRLDWARATSSAPALSTEEALDRRGRAREEVQSAMHTLLGEGNLLCFIPVAAPPPLPGGAAEAEYRARTFMLQGPAGMASLPQLVVPAGVCKTTQLPLPAAFVAARGHDRRLLELAAAIGSTVQDASW